MPVARDRAAAVTNEYLVQFRPLSGHKQECCRYTAKQNGCFNPARVVSVAASELHA